ncbi:MAG TPA: S26 family signal peptidase, partial [Gemmataceae bacterium]
GEQFAEGKGGFEIVRKGVAQLLADRRIVWDNDKQPKELAGKALPRWYAPGGSESQWSADNPALPMTFTHSGDNLGWVRYRHLIFPWDHPETASAEEPQLIDNMLGYNSEISQTVDPRNGGEMAPHSGGYEKEWVGDLILECEAVLGSNAEVVLELSKGLNRFQATFANGTVKLSSTGPGAREFASRPCKVKASGNYKLRFANVDARLHVWVNNHHIDFGTDGDYLPGSTVPADSNANPWTKENDIDAPASIGAKGDASVRAIKLHRDIFYTEGPSGAYIYYVQPGHYMCMGDNSAQSSDSRMWGAVPERLMLGQAVFVFWPSWLTPPNRIGLIK